MIRLLIYILALLVPLMAQGKKDDNSPVVVISSYNPDVANTQSIITSFNETIAKRHVKNHPMVLESMNCMNLSEAPYWKARLQGILGKYIQKDRRPALVVLLGAEASSAYFSIKDTLYKQTPVVVSMRSNSIVELPNDTSKLALSEWNPEVHYLDRDYPDYNIVGGCLYRYNISKNLELLKLYYPDTDTLLFLSDNTLGGVTMQAHFKDVVRKHPEYTTEFLDGRKYSVLDINNLLLQKGPNNAIVIGTWRIDSSDNYSMTNTTYTLAQNSEQLPAISLSSVGRGHWSFGGYTPQYTNTGELMGNIVADFLKKGKPEAPVLLENAYFFDYNKVDQLGIDPDRLNAPYTMLNKPVTFIEEHWLAILAVALVILLLGLGLTFSLYYLRRSRQLSHDLSRQSRDLAEALKQAEEANQMKSQFIASMSHEIRTPLNAVVGFSQILTADGMELTKEETRDITERIILNTDLLLKLINDILDLSRLDAGRARMTIEEVEFVGLMEMAVDSARVNLQPDVLLTCHSSVPQLKMQTDASRLMQVFANLLSNAKKCTEKGNIHVDLNYQPGSETITVSVSDTGCGIPPEKAETVFQRFEKLDEFRQGTGLGLSITRTIIEQLGGHIWVDTSYTQGARFVFTLPAPLQFSQNQ